MNSENGGMVTQETGTESISGRDSLVEAAYSTKIAERLDHGIAYQDLIIPQSTGMNV